MRNTLNECLQTVRQKKRRRSLGLAVLIALSLVVSGRVFRELRQTGLALAGAASCGVEEHTHVDECFEEHLICECRQGEHCHEDACRERVLFCGKPEHIHELSCYSDETADVESQLDWQQMFGGIITGDLRADLTAVAHSQLGYTESERNYSVSKEGIRRGYTRYGAWYGMPYGDWSAMFVSFCLHYAGSSATNTPYNTGADTMRQLWSEAGLFVSAREYKPQSGDVIFFSDNTVGIVSAVSFDVLTVIKGDDNHAVRERTVMAYEDYIVGYGVPRAAGDTGAACVEQKELTEKETAAGEGTDNPPVRPEINAGAREVICEEIVFRLESGIPETVAPAVTAPAFTQEERLSMINPNVRECVNWSAIYEIILLDGEEIYAPDTPVPVTVVLPDRLFDSNTEFFAVAALSRDEAADQVADGRYVTVAGRAFTLELDGTGTYLLYTVDQEAEGGERVSGTEWVALRDSGYSSYWENFAANTKADPPRETDSAKNRSADKEEPSDVQIDRWGGESTNGDGVVAGKTIKGTELENVFDITLTIRTRQSVSEIYEEPDMAVVIVMDISNTMNEQFGNVTRYEAAMRAAEGFIDQFAAGSGKVSRIGYVAFNSDAHEIFGLSACSTSAQATALKNTMRKKTGAIIHASGYGTSRMRFTNIEAGLKRGADMLAGAQNENKYIIFLSDGFPTTYIKSGYTGYDPYCSAGTPGRDGVFYDSVTKKYCTYGTSYSDKAAVRARTQAGQIKSSGIKIFSIGVDIGGQTIMGYERSGVDFSILDRAGKSYEIGSASDATAFRNWLKNSIGSGYYYDSTNLSGLQAAYNEIFAEIRRLKEMGSAADWVAQDPLPYVGAEYLEFIGFYNKDGLLQATGTNLAGMSGAGLENTADYAMDAGTGLNTITWDLKQSGYAASVEGGAATYDYRLMYRVRLRNEQSLFVENQVYETNAPTTLTYRFFETTNGMTTVSEQRRLSFKIPAVHGWLSELRFEKQDFEGRAVAGAAFSLTHDDAACPACRGDGVSTVTLPVYTAVSDAAGTVVFSDIPSGHCYTLRETKAPPGYIGDSQSYAVVVAYDRLTPEEGWTGIVVNRAGMEFPATGGTGTFSYYFVGIILLTLPLVWRRIQISYRKKG